MHVYEAWRKGIMVLERRAGDGCRVGRLLHLSREERRTFNSEDVATVAFRLGLTVMLVDALDGDLVSVFEFIAGNVRDNIHVIKMDYIGSIFRGFESFVSMIVGGISASRAVPLLCVMDVGFQLVRELIRLALLSEPGANVSVRGGVGHHALVSSIELANLAHSRQVTSHVLLVRWDLR